MSRSFLSLRIATFFVSLTAFAASAQEPENEPLVVIDFERGTVTGEISDEDLAHSLLAISASEDRRQLRNGFKTFSNFLLRFEEAKKDERRYRALDISSDQEDFISELSARFHFELANIEGAELAVSEKNNRRRILENNYLSKLATNFVPLQMEQFRNWNVVVGLPKMLIKSGYGDSIGLTSEQKDKIREESDRLVEEIANATLDFRLRSARLVHDQLSDKQRQVLSNTANLKLVNDLAEHASLKDIVQMHNLEKESLKKFERTWGERYPDYTFRVWPEKSSIRKALSD